MWKNIAIFGIGATVVLFLALVNSTSTNRPPIGAASKIRSEVKITPSVTVLREGSQEKVSTVSAEIQPIQVLERFDGTLEVEDTVGKIKVGDEVFDLAVSLNLKTRRPHKSLKFNIIHDFTLDSGVGLSLEVNVPFIDLIIWPTLSTSGVFINFPKKLTRNTSVFLGFGKDFKNRNHVSVGIGFRL